MLSKSLRQEALAELEGTTCDCGKKKATRQSFCRTCYYSLPEDMRGELYRSFGSGYEEAWDEARDHLRQERKAKGW